MSKFFAAALLIAVTAVGFAQTASNEAPQEKEASAEQVVVHLSHFTDDLHRAVMALKIGKLMQENGSQVTLFLDLEGVRLVERRQTLDLSWGADAPTLGELYEQFTGAGGRALICPHCAKSARIGEMSLKRHAAIASEQDLAEMFAGADKVIDY
jgi:predicted peroxiredoxin